MAAFNQFSSLQKHKKPKKKFAENQFDTTLRLFNVLPNFIFSTSGT